MKKVAKTFIAGLMALGLNFFPSKAESKTLEELSLSDYPSPMMIQINPRSDFGAELDSNIFTKRFFYGIKLEDSLTWQNSLGISYGNFAFNFFNNRDLERGIWTKRGVLFSISERIKGNIIGAIGISGYDLRTEEFASAKKSIFDWLLFNEREVYAGAILNSPPLYPAVFYHRLFGRGHGYYVQANVTKRHSLNEMLRLDLGLETGYHKDMYVEEPGFNHVGFRSEMLTNMGWNITATPSFNFLFYPEKKEIELYYGLNVRYELK